MKRKLNNFFNPKTIAIIGASQNPQKVGGILFNKLNTFKKKFAPINPKYSSIKNIRCYSSIKNCPLKIDLAVITTPAKTIAKILKQCSKKKIRNIIIISSGFGEIKKFSLQNKIAKIIKKHKLNVLGPNCFGIANPSIRLDTTFSNNFPKKGNTAFISQSGALWSYVADLQINFSGYISLGNMLDLDFSDWIQFFSKDKKTKKIVLYMERIKDGKKFIETCKKSKKKIFVIKAGQTPEGKKAIISHTASLATEFEIYKGAFKQAGIKICKSLGEAFELKIKKLYIKNQKVIIITNAGGAGALIADTLIKNKNILTKPPIDLLGTASAEDYSKELKKLEKQKYKHKIITILTPQKMSEPEKLAKIISNSKLKKQIIAIFLGQKSLKKAIKILKQNKIKTYTKI